ncbi:MAG: formate C-acetyltransferase/glycerol dehydratase family glycyl radical enzyme, partial [Deltaproteobacteria bacterium]|nr:formate C-acetyltransferase/glycerol dehydratase family glycyl radical enzyme [Deltaproteobacteria bacterium]
WTVDSERAILATEGYKKYDGEPQLLKVAKTTAHIMNKVKLHIVDDQLMVGDSAAPPKSCPIYPEFSFDWIVNELSQDPIIRERPHNRYDYNDKVRDDLLGMADYWKGKTLSDEMLSRLSPDEMKGDFMGIMLYSTSLYHFAGVGHLVPNFDGVLSNGLGGLRQQVQERLDALDDNDDRRTFYQAQLINLDSSINYIHRYASLAREKAAKAEGQRRDELLQMADNLQLIAEKPPQTFWQAYQLIHLVWSIIIIESNGHSVSLGRLDQTLYPYFRRDIDEKVCSHEFIQEIIECLAPLNASFMKLRDWLTTQANSGRGLNTTTVTLGGMDADGNDVTNELSGMFLDMIAHTRLANPWIAVRLHPDTPNWFENKAAK